MSVDIKTGKEIKRQRMGRKAGVEMSEPRSKCCGATIMSAEGHGVYCSKCGGICEIISPESDRIERMLKWLIISTFIENQMNLRGRLKKDSKLGKELYKATDELLDMLPNIDDVIREKTKKPDVSNAIFLLEGALFAIMGHSKRKDKDEQTSQIENALDILGRYGTYKKKK